MCYLSVLLIWGLNKVDYSSLLVCFKSGVLSQPVFVVFFQVTRLPISSNLSLTVLRVLRYSFEPFINLACLSLF